VDPLAGPAFKTYQFIADTMDADQYSRETFVNHVTEQSTYGVMDFERRGKGEAGECICISPLRDPETIMETIREDSRFEDLSSRRGDYQRCCPRTAEAVPSKN